MYGWKWVNWLDGMLLSKQWGETREGFYVIVKFGGGCSEGWNQK